MLNKFRKRKKDKPKGLIRNFVQNPEAIQETEQLAVDTTHVHGAVTDPQCVLDLRLEYMYLPSTHAAQSR